MNSVSKEDKEIQAWEETVVDVPLYLSMSGEVIREHAGDNVAVFSGVR